MKKKVFVLSVALMLLAFLVVGCGGDSGGTVVIVSSPSPSPTASASPSPSPTVSGNWTADFYAGPTDTAYRYYEGTYAGTNEDGQIVLVACPISETEGRCFLYNTVNSNVYGGPGLINKTTGIYSGDVYSDSGTKSTYSGTVNGTTATGSFTMNGTTFSWTLNNQGSNSAYSSLRGYYYGDFSGWMTGNIMFGVGADGTLAGIFYKQNSGVSMFKATLGTNGAFGCPYIGSLMTGTVGGTLSSSGNSGTWAITN